MTGTFVMQPASRRPAHAGKSTRWPLRPLAALTAVALFAVIGAGCSNSPTSVGSSGIAVSSTVATAAAATGTGNSDGSTEAMHEQAVKFAECMRANGVSAFPDPDPSGQFTIDAVANGSSLDTNGAAFRQALSACKDLEPAGFTGKQRSPEQQAAALKFAQCVRDNGVKDFPDPAPDGPLIDTNRIPSAARPGGIGVLNAAMRKCSDFAAAAGVTGGK